MWNDDQIRALLSSVLKFYPIGVLMTLKYNPHNLRFKYRSFAGVKSDHEPICLVLDGQQRLTSLYNALFSKSPVETKDSKGNAKLVYYYLNIDAYFKDDDENIIVSVPENKLVKTDFGRNIVQDLRTQEDEIRERMFPLNRIFDKDVTNWFFDDQWKNTPYENLVRALHQNLVVGLYSYKIPVISLSDSVPKEAVCQIFENVNTGGVALTVFELLTAIYAADDYNLVSNWESQEDKLKKSTTSELLKEVSSTDFLTTVTLISKYFKGGSTVSCTNKDILKLTLSDYKKYSDNVCHGFIEASLFLVENSIFTSKNIPYNSQLIPLSAIATALGKKFNDSPVKEKIKQWYWCGVFGEMYGGSNYSRYANDLVQVIEWIKGGELPDTIQRSSFSATRLLSLTTRQSAAYKGLVALIISNGAKDWLEGSLMDFKYFYNLNIDIHHIFPKEYCKKIGLPKEKYDSIINKTPLSRRTNEIIGGTAPSKYLNKLVSNGVEEQALKRCVRSHFIDYSLLSSNDFNSFISDRANKILDAIECATGKQTSDRDNDLTLKSYGTLLQRDNIN